jgi:hypothetical protein
MRKITPERIVEIARDKIAQQIRNHHHTRLYHRTAWRDAILQGTAQRGKVDCDLSPPAHKP